jgi:hypothetical protein
MPTRQGSSGIIKLAKTSFCKHARTDIFGEAKPKKSNNFSD